MDEEFARRANPVASNVISKKSATQGIKRSDRKSSHPPNSAVKSPEAAVSHWYSLPELDHLPRFGGVFLIQAPGKPFRTMDLRILRQDEMGNHVPSSETWNTVNFDVPEN